MLQSHAVKTREVSSWASFSNKLNAALLSCCHTGLLGHLKPFHLPFPVAMSASCHRAHRSEKSLQEAQGEQRAAAHVQNYGADPAPEHRGYSQSKCRRLPLVQGQCTISSASRNLYDVIRDCWKGQSQWWKGLSEPQVPPNTLGPKTWASNLQPMWGSLCRPLPLTVIFGLFCFLSLRVFSFPGRAVRPRHFASSAVQHCWSCCALVWELLLPVLLLQSPPARTAWWQFSRRKCIHTAICGDSHCLFSSKACLEKRSEAGFLSGSSQKLPVCQHIKKGVTGK